MHSHSPVIEPLESRIAPAYVFVSPAASGLRALQVYGEDGFTAVDTQNEVNAISTFGSTAAVLLQAGDSLVFDVNDNGKFDAKKDLVLMQVTAGSAMVFLTDEAGPRAGAFDRNEISGVALGTGFAGTIYTDVNGTIATTLTADGAAGTDLAANSIASLTVKGQVIGDILAGASISELTLGKAKFNKLLQKASLDGDIATGTAAANRPLDYGVAAGSSTMLGPQPFFLGSDISNVTIPNGLHGEVLAGDGLSIGLSLPGAGGSISDLTILKSSSVTRIQAGSSTSGATGRGGLGGSLTDIKISGVGGADDAVLLIAGSGSAATFGSGGNGGNITGLDLSFTKAIGSLTIRAGNGGASTSGLPDGNGGQGGNVSDLDVKIAGAQGLVEVRSGNGGETSSQGGQGGDGGALTDVIFKASGGKKGTLGGAVQFFAGVGGVATNATFGGAGGAVDDLTVTLQSNAGGLSILGGTGGLSTANDLAAPGDSTGGSVSNVTIKTKALAQGIAVAGGAGGAAVRGVASDGGDVSAVKLTTGGRVSGSIAIYSGGGGSVGGFGTAGDAGSVTDVTLNSLKGAASISITGSYGGSVTSQPSNDAAQPSTAGLGGSVSKVRITNKAALATGAIGGGGGGSVSSENATGDGGDGGSVSEITIIDTFGGNKYSIYAGLGKAARGTGAVGGDTGSVSKVKLQAAKSDFRIKTPFDNVQSGTSTNGNGGAGGLISEVTGQVRQVSILATAGGNSQTGAGGGGGSIESVNLTKVTGFAHIIAAGDGGNGVTPGQGGSISNVKLAGDIGDFKKPFGLVDEADFMGGLAAGKSGTGSGGGVLLNGTISDVTARRIAAIVAGLPENDELSARNAVASLVNIKAKAIGADLNKDKIFSYEDSPLSQTNRFDLGGEDIAIDGLVLVIDGQGGDKLSPKPLKLIEVPNPLL